MSPPVFLAGADALERGTVVLDGPEGRHAAAVRRLRPGERVDLTDGAGLLAECVVTAADRASLTLDVLARHREPPPAPRIVVVQALPKGDRGELAVETMTEAGVDAIVPWAAERCVTRWRPERRDKALGRWRATAREAAKQARRTRLPEVPDLASTEDVAARIADASLALVLHEEAGAPLSGVEPPAAGDIVLVVGPEGGITEGELERFAAAGGRAVRLGPTVLRTSTAGVAAGSVLLAATGRW
ncbi:16S rRNA (uracil1498-N3)-methyltransferase [Actinomadura meyerae]|jgi:16S rRNA (uracil1498-N3)-methyltransferase|uniref:Ribosomal RNA small subunit methyltransferase E n=1 Tax=Actinomadura meyerae TaxID=240840 RepID=A0A239BXN8_9ACTN|nr:16S rRNA (uracil(1498)-N(3))-methyltransferase [Actinomadura meyerae]SNS11933.1 16S rRNA (uracil1498-N3)-methyltransferase [Actinomadura meyerae]